MTYASLQTIRMVVVCPDGSVRRFYRDATYTMFEQEIAGRVMYDGNFTGGKAVASNDGWRFIPYVKGAIVETNGWHRSARCGAVNYCNRAQRCVGGCNR